MALTLIVLKYQALFKRALKGGYQVGSGDLVAAFIPGLVALLKTSALYHCTGYPNHKSGSEPRYK